MKISSAVAIFSGWFFGGLILGGGFLYIFNPLAGLALLTLILMGITMIVIPSIHIAVSKLRKSEGRDGSSLTVVLLVAAIFALALALSATGKFNFT